MQIYIIFDKYKKIFYFCTMIQRIQSVFMLLAGIATLLLFWTSQDVEFSFFSFIIGILIGSTFGNIFNFKNRKRQIMLNNISIIINALLIGILGYWLLNLSGGIDFPEKGIEPIFPLIAIIFLLLANKNIGRDERLVKSVDRLR